MKHLISVLGAGAVLLLATPAEADEHPTSEGQPPADDAQRTTPEVEQPGIDTPHTMPEAEQPSVEAPRTISESHKVTMESSRASQDGYKPAFAASRAGAFVDIWPTRDNLSAIFGGELQLGITKELYINLSYAAAFARVGDAIDAGDNLGFSNPTIGLHAVASPSDRFHLFAGVSATMPLLQDPNQEVSNAAFYGQRIRGLYEVDRFARGHLGARAAVGMEWRATDALYIRGELRPLVLIPTSDKYTAIADDRLDLPTEGAGQTEVVVEQAAEIEGRMNMGMNMGLGIGARLQGVAMMMRDDMMQLTAEPFINLTPRNKGVYARVGVPIALDEELGPGFDRNKLVCARLQIGGQW